MDFIQLTDSLEFNNDLTITDKICEIYLLK